MKITDASNREWKLLGDLELAFSAQTEDLVSTRLEEILEPLDLPADFRIRIFSSAQEAIARISQSKSALLEIGHIHLLILIPPDHSSKGKTWGFFRIEKMDGAGKGHHPSDHSIEFYLYMESR